MLFRNVTLIGSVFLCACGSDAFTNGTPTTDSSSNGSGSNAVGAGGSGATGSGAAAPTTGAGASAGAGVGGSGGEGAGLPGQVRIIATGDTGKGSPGQHCVADAMNDKCGQDGCDAVWLAGDNFYDEGVKSIDDALWVSAFEAPYDRPNLDGLKFYAVLGNHDYAPPPFDLVIDHDGSKQAQIDYSTLPVGTRPGTRLSDKWTMPSAYYSQQFGGGLVELFGIDSQDCSQSQLSAMHSAVSASTAVWKISMAHHPRFTSGDHNKDNDYLDVITSFPAPGMYDMLQGIYCNTDVFLCGHDHTREFIGKGQDSMCPNTNFIVSGAGARTTSSEQPAVANQEYFDDTTAGFFYLIVDNASITVESYDVADGECLTAGAAPPVFSRVITK